VPVFDFVMRQTWVMRTNFDPLGIDSVRENGLSTSSR